ncbi:hypothetical protein [Pseudomonas sp. BN102]|uniref:hypothetical protein n=1 Tax=Pseudomonas sp. BN102 TaxID=2567886 RepID=UPI0024547668|nr:hypothetical protein [Pseudomonas sp. BN102]
MTRSKEWRLSFTGMDGDFSTASRKVTNVPSLTNLLAASFQSARDESNMYQRWAGDQAWLMAPIQTKVKTFLATLSQYPFQEASASRRQHQLPEPLPEEAPGEPATGQATHRKLMVLSVSYKGSQ